MKTQFTPGPLHAQGTRVMRGNTIIAETFPTSLTGEAGEEHANARAYAALPDLVAAMESLTDKLDGMGILTDHPAMIRARAALAKVHDA